MGVGALCPACGTQLRAAAQYCDACGTAVKPASAAEYKQVTVLFADVVHSMDLAARVGPERLRDIMADLVDRCAATVRRYGGTPDKFTGDGIMAVFGAPVALEDHAVRGCLAALQIQALDLDLQLRVGLNSGQVIVGEIGSGPWGYTAIGEAVGLAQRMEAVAPPGEVMLSESTARLVGGVATLSEPELVHIKGAADPVSAHRLVAVTGQHGFAAAETNLVGRQWELTSLTEMLTRALAGRGTVVGVVGPAGIGKSRLVHEATAIASRQGFDVYAAFCESHTRDIPFHAVTQALRAFGGSAQIRSILPEANTDDLVLLDDLLGIRDAEVPVPEIEPEARRRRLTALINATTLARTNPVLYIVEDTHWIDPISESMFADFVAVVPRSPTLVLFTYRPEYRGALSRMPGAQTIALAPLRDAQIAELGGALLGRHASVDRVVALITDRAAGNPFFAAEMVRDLAERGIIVGHRGDYRCHAAVDVLSVPPTLQATIAARIDRLDVRAKRTLNAASVIGVRFGTELFGDLDVEPALAELIAADLIDQCRFGAEAEYAFRHPLIRTVAYESQLKADRAELHRRLAAGIERHHPDAADDNAALIAEHLEAAGELRSAYHWHMRAGAWSSRRNIAAAQVSWQRASAVADQLPDAEDRDPMRIGARTLRIAHAFRSREDVAGPKFDEFRGLCEAAGDKTSLTIGMAGLVGAHLVAGRMRAAAAVVAEHAALIEATGDPALTVGLSASPISVKMETGEFADALRWAQAAIDAAAGNIFAGDILLGSPVTLAVAARGIARAHLGITGWQADMDQAVTMTRTSDALCHAAAIGYSRGLPIGSRMLIADDAAVRDIEQAVRVAEASGDDIALGISRFALGVALVRRGEDLDRALDVLHTVREMCLAGQYYRSEVSAINTWMAEVAISRGEFDPAIRTMRRALAEIAAAGQLGYAYLTIEILAEALLARGWDRDADEVAALIDKLAALPYGPDVVARDVVVLRLRAALARTRGEPGRCRELATRYRQLAARHGYRGHLRLAEALLAD